LAGIYIHIPFCKQACHYCNFHFSTSLRHKSALIKAICTEVELRTDYMGTEEIETIYFGGGTPSLLDADDLSAILEALGGNYSWTQAAEITLEANPDDLTLQKLIMYKSLGINRLSIGVQSFFDEDLHYMNRAHNATEALSSIKQAQQIGIDDISIDLIYGSPTTSMKHWKQNIDIALSLDIPHISSYCLTVESKTPLQKMIKSGLSAIPSAEIGAMQFDALVAGLTSAGYDHYEISNFAKPGRYARHNTNYWRGKAYLGLGPSAHSYDGSSRAWNIANNNIYIRDISEGKSVLTIEHLSDEDKYNETLMTGLRTMWGVDLSLIESINPEWVSRFVGEIQSQIDLGYAIKDEQSYKLTAAGKHFADKIAMELFIV
jgi:oxygen-independent coproporphyrinogen III oxidase